MTMMTFIRHGMRVMHLFQCRLLSYIYMCVVHQQKHMYTAFRSSGIQEHVTRTITWGIGVAFWD